jgi:hydroxypyruvate reductase
MPWTPAALVRRALVEPSIARALNDAAAVHVIAAGKAASVMLDACVSYGVTPRTMLGIGPAGSPAPPAAPSGTRAAIRCRPRQRRGRAACAGRGRARARDELLLVLLSGGGSALMSLPADGVTLEEKQQTVRRLLEAGADIHELNTVRKHLSAIKGGCWPRRAPGAP